MISLISPALIIGSLSCCLLLRETSMDLRQLSVQASVDEKAPYLGHEAAEQLAIGDLFEHDRLAAQRATELASQCRPFGVGERDRCPHATADAVLRFVVDLTKRRNDGLEMIGVAVRGDEREKVLGELRDLEPPADLDRDRSLGRRRDPGTREERLQFGLGGELRRDRVELTRDDVHLVTLAREV